MADKEPKGDRLSNDRLRMLENLHANLARKMASSFSTMERSVVDCDIKFVDQTSYAEFIMSLSNPSCTYTFTLDPLGGPAIIDFALPTAYSFIDRQFGGTGSNPPSERRPLTAIERTVMTKVVIRTLANLEATWEPVLKIRVRDAELETNPEYAQIVRPSASVILFAFEVHSQHASGLVQLCYPFDTLAPALKYMSPGGAPPLEAGRSTALSAPLLDPAPKPPDIPADASLEQIASDRPAVTAGAVEALLSPADGSEDAKGPWKAAVLIACLPRNVSTALIRHLSSEARKSLAQAVTDLQSVTAANRDEVFEELKGRLIRGDYVLQGVVEAAQQVVRGAATGSSGFRMLRNVDPSQIVPFIVNEHPQAIALILSQLDSRQAAGVVNGLSKELAADVTYRIARMESISPQVLRELEDSLAQELQSILSGQVTEIGGPKAVAHILNSTGRSTEKSVLERIDKQDAECGEEIRNQMFVYDDIAHLTDKEIQLLLKEVPREDLAVGLKGADDRMKSKVIGNLSEEDATSLKEEMKFSGPIRMSDVEEVQLRTVKLVRKLEEEGKVKIVRGDSTDKFV